MDALEALQRMTPKLPKAIGMRFHSTFNHIERAKAIFDIDREMASFRAITAEEEAATALMMALQAKEYPNADKFKAWSHPHKAAVLACVMAIAGTLQPVLKEYQVVFRFDKARIDIKIPLSNFNVARGEDIALQPVEPLGMLHSRAGVKEDSVFHDALTRLANGQGFEDARTLIRTRANARNTLLYASDSKLPLSRANLESLSIRENSALILLSLAVMVIQAKGHQPMVKQAIPAFLRVIGRAEQDNAESEGLSA